MRGKSVPTIIELRKKKNLVKEEAKTKYSKEVTKFGLFNT